MTGLTMNEARPRANLRGLTMAAAHPEAHLLPTQPRVYPPPLPPPLPPEGT